MQKFLGDMMGGVVGAIMIVPIILSCGVVSYQSLGANFISVGIMAAFVAAVCSAIVSGLFGGPPLHISSPKTSHAVILSALIASIAGHHSFSDYFSGNSAAVALVVICIITLFLSGIMQALLGFFRMGSFVKFVPYPVLAGIINGFALQIMIGQIPNGLGVQNLSQVWQEITGKIPVHGWSLGLMLLSALLVAFSSKLIKKIPSALVGLVGGTLAYIAATKFTGISNLVPVVGQLPSGIHFVPQLSNALDVMQSYSFQHHLFAIFATAATLALVSSIQSLLSISNADELFSTRHNSNKELLVQGCANAASAMFGGTPSGGSPNLTRAVYNNGGRTRFANIMMGIALIGMSYGLNDLIAVIPLSVMAGVVIATTVSSMDSWTQQLLRKVGISSTISNQTDVLGNLAIVVFVTFLVVFEGVLAALGVGMAITLLIFLHNANKTVIRRVVHPDQMRSRTDRSMEAVNALIQESQRIAYIDLHGPLFFGNVETVFQKIEKEMLTADWIILSFKHCGMIDTTGAMTLKRLDKSMSKTGKKLLLSHLPFGGQRRKYLRNIGIGEIENSGRVFEDNDSALAFAEDELLHTLGLSNLEQIEKPLAEFDIVASLSPEQIANLTQRMERLVFPAHQFILRKDCCDEGGLYFITRGRVSVIIDDHAQMIRLASYSAGVGALFSKQLNPHVCDVYADTEITLLKLSCSAFDKLCQESPTVGLKLLKRMNIDLSSRLNRMTHLALELELEA
ncbi:SLC26A/SulP transporter family protein [Acinetobacter sp. ANC 4641]|uniref:SLC26A/SulP transporter family protein n=1 Tax=Acinetobacter sp. ANC 4641 TaxID=2529847 RepID=UPI00103EB89D|nr:SulP family inorganic anion transporter [Acinetobacter sp. ANC 4641]TCB08850.1 STAS domain-containing protein [Acinetobacter sp. ANC 4641]